MGFGKLDVMCKPQRINAAADPARFLLQQPSKRRAPTKSVGMSASLQDVLQKAGLSSCNDALIEFGVESAEDLAFLQEEDVNELGLKPIQSRKLVQLVKTYGQADGKPCLADEDEKRKLQQKIDQLSKENTRLAAKQAPRPSCQAVNSGAARVSERANELGMADETAQEQDEVIFQDALAGKRAAALVLPGNEDPGELMRRGGLELSWADRKVTKFRETHMRHVVSADLLLPTLYLHFLDAQFHVQGREYDLALRGGNDNSELQLVLPDAEYLRPEYDGVGEDLREHLQTVVKFLQSQAEVMTSDIGAKRGSFTPKTNYKGDVNPQRMYFALKAARPKAPISLDKKAFGIPEGAQIYLFAENHISVNFMTERDTEAFEKCIGELPSCGDAALARFSIFLKVFFEGGFAYNQKIECGNGYLPKNVGIACMDVIPAFEGQVGIATGYPYIMESSFLPFTDTVPVTISAIRNMSSRHKRYGLCFTRCVHVWETDALEREGALNFCSIIPHGGFYYVPSNLQKYKNLGGLVYAFGESKEALEMPAESKAPDETPCGFIGYAAPSEAPDTDLRACVICLSENAIMATVPCGHRAFCASDACTRCATGRSCPVCRTPVTGLMRIY